VTAGDPAQVELDRGRVRLADALLVYVERTLAAADPSSEGVLAAAYGLAPTALAERGAVLAALAPGEAVWLGFQAVDETRPAVVRVHWSESPPDAAGRRLVCPPEYRLPGLYGEGNLTVSLDSPTAADLEIRLVSLETFTNVTGEPAEPLDRESSYKGWRLP
jgi:hypothetical protein